MLWLQYCLKSAKSIKIWFMNSILIPLIDLKTGESMIKKNSLHFKLNMFILSMLFLIVSIGFIIAINIFINIYEADVLKNISSGVPEFRAVVIDKNKDQLLSFAEGLIDPSYQLLTQKNSNNEESVHDMVKLSARFLANICES